MKLRITVILCSFMVIFNSFANELKKPASKDISISVYNNDLALVRDQREVSFEKGVNNMAFEGVASQIKSESVIIMGHQIDVLEQNYDYALLTPHNIIEKSVGQKIKTVLPNPTTGEAIFNEATLISYQNGQPVLSFDYGIETNFDGRLVFEKLPSTLMQKPTLEAKILSENDQKQDIMLAYLTKGLSWKVNYVAGIKDENMLDLTGWVTITNNSGVSYDNAKVQLIAGDVNEVRSYGVMPRNVMMAKAANFAIMEDAADTDSVMPESFNAYQLYNLKNRTSIQDNQEKQLALIEQTDVKYNKEGRLVSSLYFSNENYATFEKVHPSIFYIIQNNKESNLGLPLPKGVVRFYENDTENNLQFVGENKIGQTAKGEKLELEIGKMFDVFVDGKIENVTTISDEELKNKNGRCPQYKTVRNYDALITLSNGGQKKTDIVFKQNLSQNMKIIKENIKGNNKNAFEHEWSITLDPDSKQNIEFTVEVTSEETRCL